MRLQNFALLISWASGSAASSSACSVAYTRQRAVKGQHQRRLAARVDHTIADYASKLREANRYAARDNEAGGQAAVRAAFDLCYADLDPGTQRVLALASKVKYVIDPDNPYPNNYTGHIRATLQDGSVIEERQPHLRGGAQEPLTRQDVIDKFILNADHGGWTKAQTVAALKLIAVLYNDRIDLSALRG